MVDCEPAKTTELPETRRWMPDTLLSLFAVLKVSVALPEPSPLKEADAVMTALSWAEETPFVSMTTSTTIDSEPASEKAFPEIVLKEHVAVVVPEHDHVPGELS